MKTVYTIGYSGRSLSEIKSIVENLDAIIFDIRFSPRSRNPEFNMRNLERELSDRYLWIKALGNAAYKGTYQETTIVNLDAGIAAIEASTRSVILMCACKDYRECHRRWIAEHLQSLGYSTNEIKNQKRATGYTQGVLF